MRLDGRNKAPRRAPRLSTTTYVSLLEIIQNCFIILREFATSSWNAFATSFGDTKDSANDMRIFNAKSMSC